MTLPVIVLGSGGHSKVLIETLKEQNVKIVGATDPKSDKHGQMVYGVDIIGDDDTVFNYAPENILLVNGLGSIGSTCYRTELFARFTKVGYKFASVIHGSAIVSAGAQLGDGVQVMAGAIIQTGALIGNNSIINTKASVDHDCHIERNVHIAPGATLSGGVYISEDVHLGAGVVVIQGIKIGKNSIIGAGSLVICDIPEGVVAYGVPAKVVRNV